MYAVDNTGKPLFNVLAMMDLPKAHYFVGLAVSVDQSKAVVIIGTKTTKKPIKMQATQWFMIRLSQNKVIMLSQGKATGLPENSFNFGVGNRSLSQTRTGVENAAMCLENDGRYLWQAQKQRTGTKSILNCYRLDSTGFTSVWQSELKIPSPFTLIVDQGVCWLAGSNKFSFFRREVQTPEPVALAEVVSSLCERAGLKLADIDVSQLSDKAIGFTIAQDASVINALETLRKAYFFDVVEIGDRLCFIPQGKAAITTIDESDLAVHEAGQALPDAITLSRQSNNTLPQKVTITYIQAANDYQRGLQAAVRQSVVGGGVINEELPLVLTDTQAVRIADKQLNQYYVQRDTYTASVSYQYLYLSPADVICLFVDKKYFTVRLTQVELGSPGLLQLQGVRELRNDYQSKARAGIIRIKAQKVILPSPTVLHCLDFAISEKPGVVLAVCGMGGSWLGCSVYAGQTDNLREIADITQATIMGETTTRLGKSYLCQPDRANTVVVRLLSGQLYSLPTAQFLQGGNLACIGDEILQFQHAVLQADGSYVLSQLIRGRCGTEQAINQHQVGERFILLDSAKLSYWQPSYDHIGQIFNIKAVSHGLALEDAAVEHFTYGANHLKPFAPVHLQGHFNHKGDLFLSWIRRVRCFGEWRDFVDVPLENMPIRFAVEISRADNSVRRVIIDTSTFIYTQQMQQQDDWQTGDVIEVAVSQCSDIVGQGMAANNRFIINNSYS